MKDVPSYTYTLSFLLIHMLFSYFPYHLALEEGGNMSLDSGHRDGQENDEHVHVEDVDYTDPIVHSSNIGTSPVPVIGVQSPSLTPVTDTGFSFSMLTSSNQMAGGLGNSSSLSSNNTLFAPLTSSQTSGAVAPSPANNLSPYSLGSQVPYYPWGSHHPSASYGFSPYQPQSWGLSPYSQFPRYPPPPFSNTSIQNTSTTSPVVRRLEFGTSSSPQIDFPPTPNPNTGTSVPVTTPVVPSEPIPTVQLLLLLK